MGTTIAGTTPYAWPWDQAFSPARSALLVIGAPDVPALPETMAASVAGLVDVLGAAGGLVVEVTTGSPRHAAPSSWSAVPAGPDAVLAAGIDGFYGSSLDSLLRSAGRDQLLLVGGWLETGVHSTLRSANDRGYECLLLLDACLPFDPALRAASRSQVEMSGGIFGAVGDTAAVLRAVPTSDHP